MNTQVATSRFQEVLDAVETLPPDDQVLLIEIVRQRLIQDRRAELVDVRVQTGYLWVQVASIFS